MMTFVTEREMAELGRAIAERDALARALDDLMDAVDPETNPHREPMQDKLKRCRMVLRSSRAYVELGLDRRAEKLR